MAIEGKTAHRPLTELIPPNPKRDDFVADKLTLPQGLKLSDVHQEAYIFLAKAYVGVRGTTLERVIESAEEKTVEEIFIKVLEKNKLPIPNVLLQGMRDVYDEWNKINIVEG